MKAPSFWYKPPKLLAKLLWPLSLAYAYIVEYRYKSVQPKKINIPVICVGNLVVGGAGKTPVVIALAKYLQEKGYQPHIISRGYGSKVVDPVQVNPLIHSAKDVGDEPILLAKQAKTWVCADRIKSANLAMESGAQMLIMDDGFQNPYLYKNLSLLVIDGKQGLGNCFAMPAGPLRESIDKGMPKADAVILIGKENRKIEELAHPFNKPIIKANIRCQNPCPTKVIAFCGLGFPDKFYKTLRDNHYHIVDEISFPDHHPYTIKELDDLLLLAKNSGAQLITTEKDILRIPDHYHRFIKTLKIELMFTDFEQLDVLLKQALL